MIYRELTPEQIAGQRIIAGFNGLSINDEIRYLIDTLYVGGLILFRRNIQSLEQVQTLCRSSQEYARICGQPPLFIAIDQEGGTVARLSAPFTVFPCACDMQSETDAAEFARITAHELKQIGVNMNNAPVLDIAPQDIPSIMAKRSYGETPSRVSQMGAAIIDHLQAGGIMAIAKHFPGIGRTLLDSHLDRPVFNTGFEELSSFDLIPFETAIRHHVSGIMLSHILYERIDPQWPASLSVYFTKTLLREKMGYTGLVLTDDLDMGAIRKYYDFATVIRQVTAAGIDLALICHQGPDIEHAFKLFLEYQEDDDYYDDFSACAARISAAKKRYLEE